MSRMLCRHLQEKTKLTKATCFIFLTQMHIGYVFKTCDKLHIALFNAKQRDPVSNFCHLLKVLLPLCYKVYLPSSGTRRSTQDTPYT